jgi:hypothetical protein
MSDDRKTIASAHKRIDVLLVNLREHIAGCANEGRMQNARLRRLEAILITSAGATIVMLISLLMQ